MSHAPPADTSRSLESSSPDASQLDELVLVDQMSSVRRSVLIAIPVNMLLGFANLLVAFDHHRYRTAMLWFGVSTLVNIWRIHLCRQHVDGVAISGIYVSRNSDSRNPISLVARQLRRFSFGALMSGFVWAGVPLLCDGYTSSSTLFYLTVVCGVTAGAVTHGTAYARVPLAFITPSLLSVVACLLYQGAFERYCLAATVLLYLLALSRSAVESEAAFREASSAKNQATSLARSLEAAHCQALSTQKQMQHQAWHDHLTGLLNRTGFMVRAAQYMPAAGRSACLMMLDLDGFKVVNDVYGHRGGDDVLAEVGRRLTAHQPTDALVARLGGDEFAILYVPELVGESPESLAQRLIDNVPVDIKDAKCLGVSIGIHISASMDLTDMLLCADEALYAAKKQGRNRFRVFDGSLRIRLTTRCAIERELPQAMVSGELDVFFQPVLREGGVLLDSVEALLRWEHPKYGLIAPSDIVFIADTSGQSESLLKHVLSRVSRLMARLQRVGLGHVRVAINLSPRKIAQIPVDYIALDWLAAACLPATMLEIEVTEETTADIDIVQSRLERLSIAGVRIAVDDFGVGFSSLSTLHRSYVRKVKIDRSLISNLFTGNHMLVEAILKLGQLLKIEVVAEGVERESELQVLRSLGCDMMQGFYLAMPMREDELFKWISLSMPEGGRQTNPLRAPAV